MKTKNKKIVLIQGHPDPRGNRLGHLLLESYANAAEQAGHEIRRIEIAHLDFPLLRSLEEWERESVPSSLLPAQEAIAWAQHIVLFFPLWMGDMPALLKGFLEQVARPGFAFVPDGDGPTVKKGLTGRSARVVVTMGMPATIYRWFFQAHSIKSLERNILGFTGIGPIQRTLIGLVGKLDSTRTEKLIRQMQGLGRAGE